MNRRLAQQALGMFYYTTTFGAVYHYYRLPGLPQQPATGVTVACGYNVYRRGDTRCRLYPTTHPGYTTGYLLHPHPGLRVRGQTPTNIRNKHHIHRTL